MEKELFRKTEDVLRRYKTLVAEVENIKLSIESMEREYKGCSSITYEEKAAPTNKFSSIVENEIIIRETQIRKLQEELSYKQIEIKKVENALEPLSEREFKIINLRYFKRIKSWNAIGEILGLTGDYCRYLNSHIIERISRIIFIEKYI